VGSCPWDDEQETENVDRMTPNNRSQRMAAPPPLRGGWTQRMQRITHMFLLLALGVSTHEPAVHAETVSARVLDPLGLPVPQAGVTIYRAVSDAAEEHGLRLETVSSGVSDTNGALVLDLPVGWTNLSVEAECTGYVPWASALGPGRFVSLRFSEGRLVGVTFLMEPSLGRDDLLALERTTNDRLPTRIRQLLSTSMLESAWDTVFHIDDKFRPHLLALREDPVVSNRVQEVLAHWYPERFASQSRPRLDFPWKAVVNTDLDEAIRSAVAPVLRAGEAEKFGVSSKSFDSTRAKVIVRCSVHHGPLNARGYVLFFRRMHEQWQLVYAGMTWVA
jgi:hypothetical protein